MSQLEARVKIKGTTSVLFNHLSLDVFSSQRRERSGDPGNDPSEWKRSFTSTPHGQLYIPGAYVFGCLREAAKYTKVGRSSLQRPLISSLRVLTERVLLNRYVPNNLDEIPLEPENDVYIDVRPVVNPNTGSRNIRYRLAAVPGWEAEFSIGWENTLVSREQMKAICNDAGYLVGLADGRAIGYGRFEIMSFEVEANNRAQIPSA